MYKFKSFFLFVLPLLWLISGTASASQEHAEYTGSKSCQECHQKIYKQWKQTLHPHSDIITFLLEGEIYV